MEKGLVFLPFPIASHLLSMVELSIRLHRLDPTFSITFLLLPEPTTTPFPAAAHIAAAAAAAGITIHTTELPAVPIPEFQPIQGGLGYISSYIQLFIPHVKTALANLPSTAALLIDYFFTAMIDVAAELSIPTFIYYCSGAASLAIMLHSPILDKEIETEFTELKTPLTVPGFPPVPSSALPDFLMEKNSISYNWYLRHGEKSLSTSGIIVNSFQDFEDDQIKSMLDNKDCPPVYPVGPLFAPAVVSEGPAKRHQCLEWLDGQPDESVVLLCFGSFGCFGAEQTREMAAALERSGHRFLWSLRSPPAAGTSYPAAPDLEVMLPEGFAERTAGRGLVWPAAVPQVEVLAHRAVGGFVTHCGYNSCLESMWHGVPTIGWPLFADHHVYAFVMEEVVGSGVQMEVDRRTTFVTSEELEKAVRRLMGGGEEGKRMRERAKAMRAASRAAGEEGGSSFVSLEKLALALARAGDA